MVKIGVFAKKVWSLRKTIVVFLTPVILSPILVFVSPKEGKCLYVILLMALYWCTEALPIAVTSLLPISLFPLFGVMPASIVCPQYFLDTNVLFMSGLIMALAVEEWNLHRRIALFVLMLVGSSPARLILGMMITTSLLSMWLSNTASTALMMPIAKAVLQSLFGSMEATLESTQLKDCDEASDLKDSTSKEPLPNEGLHLTSEDSKSPEEFETNANLTLMQQKVAEDRKKLWKGFLVSIPYAASIGGTATLTGTTPNLILVGQLKIYFPACDDLNFASWFIFSFPLAFLFLIVGWVWIAFLHGGFNIRSCRKKGSTAKTEAKVMSAIKYEYSKLGPFTYAEGAVSMFFFLFAVLLFTRDPKFITGWAILFPKGYVSDAVTGMTIVIMLCFFPSQKPSLKWWFNPKASGKTNPPLLTWSKIQSNLPWSVILLLGGGYAIAKGCEVSGLSIWISKYVHPLAAFQPSVALILISILVTFFTEFASNTATIVIMLPILINLCLQMKMNPLYFLVPATIVCSYAFMLPISTPPNSIAFATGHLKVKDMVKSGIIMNILGILLLLLAVNTWGNFLFDFSTFPQWAEVMQNATHSFTNGTA
ncbi:solute carrier family 13 member 3 [Leucoraja erinacea]|uniref:solute carrier family 13 member 3 n=1 Tax=Leucoraja erinaceus TaxID=7782 RepID=UPI002458FCE9|nr:solute carrier family 13 member 3 [Leucoraja erinacea]